MANRAKPRARTKAARGKIKSRGKVATLPKQSTRKAKGNNHNGGPGITDDQIADWQGKLDKAFKKVQDAQAEVRQNNGVYRNMLKTADKEGFDSKAYIDARTLDKEDHGLVQVRFANIGRQLKVRGSNLATEIGLFQDLEPPQPGEDEAPAVRGLKAGRGGFSRTSNPYKPGSEDYQVYDANWLQGQTEIAGRMAPDSEATH